MKKLCQSKNLFFSLIFLFNFIYLSAQEIVTQDSYEIPPWYMSLNGGAILFEGDEATKNGFVGQLKLGYDWTSILSFEASLIVAPYLKKNTVYDYHHGYPEERETLKGNSTFMIGGAVDGLFHFNWLDIDDRHFDPYIIGGLGVS